MDTRMTRREFARLVAAGSLGAAVTGAVPAQEDARPRKPNILLLMTDQHRPDCVGYTGNKVIKTPNLDRLAKDGAWFRHAYSTTPSCTPARAALLTGQSPWHHGMLGYGKIAKQHPFEFTSALRDAGYYTACFGKTHYTGGDTHGFDEIHSDYGKWFVEKMPGKDARATGLESNDHRGKQYVYPEEVHSIHWTGQTAVDFVRGYDREQPLFLKVSFYYPHSPYDAPKRFWDMYDPRDIPMPQAGDWAKKYAPIERPMNNSLWHGKVGDEVARKARHGYYGNITFIDEQMGGVIKALDDKGMLDDTLILFIADHGDMTGDQNLWRKTYAYEPSAGIPMFIRWPKGACPGRKRGIVLDQPVEIRDAAPTFLDVAGVDIPKSVDGRSLLNLVRGETKDWRKYIDLEHSACYKGTSHWVALTDGKWKYILDLQSGDEQLFHLEDDPRELHDLVTSGPNIELWRGRMAEHLAERGPDWVNDGKPVPRRKSTLYSPNFPHSQGAGRTE